MTKNEILAEIKALQAKSADLEIDLQWIPPLDGPRAWEHVPDPNERRRVPQWGDPLPRLPLSTQFVRLKFKDMGPGHPRGDFEVEV